MKLKHLILFSAVTAMGMNAMAQDTFVTWEVVGNNGSDYTHRFVVKGDMSFDRLAYNMLPRKMKPVDPTVKISELMPGYYTIESEKFKTGADSVVIDIITPGTFSNASYGPDGIHRIEKDQTTRPVKYTRKPVTQPIQWRAEGATDRMPYADQVYDLNAELQKGKAAYYDIVPKYKNVVLTGGLSTLPLKRGYKTIASEQPEYYTITIANDSVIVGAADPKTAEMAMNAFDAQILRAAAGQVPNAVIEDWPDFPYRGVMIDVVRNFQPIDELYRIVDYLAEYRMNTLHFHLFDDEAWRLEIAALPELTSYSGRRGYSPNEEECLYQLYSGNGDPNSKEGVSNGYYTREDFVNFLRYADSKGVQVIPEVEMPGHARAAVKAMEKRYRSTGDASYRMMDETDKSEYTSAQAYHDNVMNPAMPGTYKFLNVVFDELIDMYKEAGVDLPAIHIGGDEVAKGAWDGSEIAQNLIKEKNLNGQTGLHGYFVERISDMLKNKGVKMSGWQEIALGHSDEYNKAMNPLTYSVNCWTNTNPNPEKNVTTRALVAGFPVVVSNVDHFYMDMCYDHHPEEPGLKWGGVVDEFKSLNGYPYKMAIVDPNSVNGQIIGVSGQLFAETLRSPQMLEYYLFPKMTGLAERSWNAEPTYSDADFNAVIQTRELPRYQASGRNFRLRMAGIKDIDGKIYMNSPYDGAEIHYTLDGSEPTADSPIYTNPIDANGVKEVRARLYYRGKNSNTSILYLK